LAAERAGLGYFRLGRSRRTTAREGPLRDVSAYPGADAWPGRDVPHATSRSYPLTPSGTEVLARLRTAPLAASVPKPSEGGEPNPKRAAAAREGPETVCVTTAPGLNHKLRARFKTLPVMA